MNAMALFSLYLYFLFTYFTIFSQPANHSLESMQRPRLFPAFFPRYFQSGAMISNNGGDIREVKHDVYGKRLTAKMKLLPSVFSSLCSRIKIFVFAVNSKRHFSIFV